VVDIHIVYEGDLHCRLTHGPSGATIATDAPKDNEGRGEAFSPTDLVAAGMGSCMLTIMGIAARRHEIDIAGTTVHVKKEMVGGQYRRIKSLATVITLPRPYDARQREILENAARSCPVHRSLHPDVEAPIRFVYP
jgi:putative redox protein